MILKVYAVSTEVFPDTHIQIQYGATPFGVFRYATRELTAVDCVRLNRNQFQVGQHCCALTVEQLPDGEFGLTCICHPLQSTSALSRFQRVA